MTGDVLPDITLKNEKGEDVNVKDLAGETQGVVFFLVPKADTRKFICSRSPFLTLVLVDSLLVHHYSIIQLDALRRPAGSATSTPILPASTIRCTVSARMPLLPKPNGRPKYPIIPYYVSDQ